MSLSGYFTAVRENYIPLAIVVLSTLLSLVVTIVLLHVGITIVFQNIYYLPIILACYFFLRKGLYFSLILIALYFSLLLIFFYTPEIMLQGIIRVLFFLLIAFLVTYLSEKIRSEKARYESIFSSSESGIVVYKRKSLTGVAANDQFTEISGYTSKDINNIHLQTLFEDQDTISALLESSESRPFQHYETVLKAKDGSRIDVLMSAGSAGKGLGSITLQDITRRKQAEAAMKMSEEKFRTLFEFSADPIFIHDLEGHILEVNSAAEKKLGYSRNELIRLEIRDINSPESAPLIPGQVKEIRENGHALFETEHITRTGERIPFETSARLFNYLGQEAILRTARDISDRKRAEAAIQQANRKLNLLNSITRHDILNSLTALRGYLELSQDLEKDQEMQQFIQKEISVANHIQRQIEFTRDYQDVGVKVSGWFNVRSILENVSHFLAGTGIQLMVDLPALEVYADPMVEKVFYNLIENAVRHGGKITHIRFSAGESPDGLVIACEDDGAGIPEDKKKAIFNREYFKHSGFGLFLSREILGISGITIRETGIPGKGARFEMLVPNGAFRFL